MIFLLIYPPPPKLNPEISAALLKQNLTTESSQCEVQNQLGKGICALGKGITNILNNIDKIPDDLKNDLLTNLLDSGRMLTNLFHRVSVTRKNLIVPLLKNMREVADKSTPSEYLFGADLSDKLKSFENIETVSKELKIPSSAAKGSLLYRKPNKGGKVQLRTYKQNDPSTTRSFKLAETGSSLGGGRTGQKSTHKKLPLGELEGCSMEKQGEKETQGLNVSSYAGRLNQFYEWWLTITSNPTILGWLKGYSLPFVELPVQARPLVSRKFSIKIPTSTNDLRRDNFNLEIFTDASLTGWGAFCQEKTAHGWWTASDTDKHINYLELQAIYYGLKCFASDLSNCYILIRTDNTTALSYIMGSIKFPKLNSLTRRIWKWCETKNIWIFASYIPSIDNWQADQASRTLRTETEWALNIDIFKEITNHFGMSDIDLFASIHNHKCKRYISWITDPEAETIDAFTVFW
ncbi:hypothetical protein NQ314_003521, partial [Rhamnusium bicolor]